MLVLIITIFALAFCTIQHPVISRVAARTSIFVTADQAAKGARGAFGAIREKFLAAGFTFIKVAEFTATFTRRAGFAISGVLVSLRVAQ